MKSFILSVLIINLSDQLAPHLNGLLFAYPMSMKRQQNDLRESLEIR